MGSHLHAHVPVDVALVRDGEELEVLGVEVPLLALHAGLGGPSRQVLHRAQAADLNLRGEIRERKGGGRRDGRGGGVMGGRRGRRGRKVGGSTGRSMVCGAEGRFPLLLFPGGA